MPTEIPDGDNPVAVFALVNYKNFWDSGLAKKMIDEFYGHLPYAPPLLYVDVLTLGGGNFSTGRSANRHSCPSSSTRRKERYEAGRRMGASPRGNNRPPERERPRLL